MATMTPAQVDLAVKYLSELKGVDPKKHAKTYGKQVKDLHQLLQAVYFAITQDEDLTQAQRPLNKR